MATSAQVERAAELYGEEVAAAVTQVRPAPMPKVVAAVESDAIVFSVGESEWKIQTDGTFTRGGGPTVSGPAEAFKVPVEEVEGQLRATRSFAEAGADIAAASDRFRANVIGEGNYATTEPMPAKSPIGADATGEWYVSGAHTRRALGHLGAQLAEKGLLPPSFEQPRLLDMWGDAIAATVEVNERPAQPEPQREPTLLELARSTLIDMLHHRDPKWRLNAARLVLLTRWPDTGRVR